MNKIYHSGWFYRLVKFLVMLGFRLYYKNISINGKEKIPKDAALIFAANHRNALMDPLSITLLTPPAKTTSFLARGDVFKNKIFAAILRIAKVMPAFRMRDGYALLKNNDAVFDECVALLEQNHTLCLMPEGGQETAHHVRPLVKGIFRIAFAVQRLHPKQKLYIIPVGLHFDNIYNFQKQLTINVGDAIDMADFTNRYTENPAIATNEIKTRLHESIKQNCLHLEPLEHHDALLLLLQFAEKSCEIQQLSSSQTLLNKQINALKLKVLAENDLEKFRQLCALAKTYDAKLRGYKIQHRNVVRLNSNIKLATEFMLLLFTFPLFATGLLLNAMPFFMPVLIRKMLQIKYHGFYSSIQFALGLLLFPLFYGIQGVFVAHLVGFSLGWLPLVWVSFFAIGKFSFAWYCKYKQVLGNVRFQTLPSLHKEQMFDMQHKIQSEISR